MREIRFRAWDKVNKEMLFFVPPTFDQDGVGLTEIFVRPELVPMQYTGLKDKNGKEIYEGDVLSFKNGIEFRADVKWFENAFLTDYFTSGEWEISEVIGNIYENPELLTNKQA